jgi:hypothetical protein
LLQNLINVFFTSQAMTTYILRKCHNVYDTPKICTKFPASLRKSKHEMCQFLYFFGSFQQASSSSDLLKKSSYCCPLSQTVALVAGEIIVFVGI